MPRAVKNEEMKKANSKVVIVVENLSVPFDRRVWRECEALVEAGYIVSVICPKGMERDCEAYQEVQGVAIHRYTGYESQGTFASYVLEYVWALWMTAILLLKVLWARGYDVIQICNPPDLLILAAVPYKLLGKRIIFDQHDLSPEIYQAQRKKFESKGLVVKALLFFEWLTYQLTDIVLVVNESCRRIAIERGGVSPEDVMIVRNAPTQKRMASVAHSHRQRRIGAYLLTYVGMMGPQEGIDVMLKSVQLLVRHLGRNDVHVLIVGGGTVLESMKQLAFDLGIADVVTFTGQVSYDEVIHAIEQADVCLCPDPKTPLSDRCSLVKVVEYMSAGKPIVAFPLAEVALSAGDAALYAETNSVQSFAEKINRLLDDAELRERMGKIGQARFSSTLAWENSKTVLLAAYERVLQ